MPHYCISDGIIREVPPEPPAAPSRAPMVAPQRNALGKLSRRILLALAALFDLRPARRQGRRC